MRDLREQLDPVWRAVSQGFGAANGRSLMFVSARTGEGVTSAAASFACMAARRSEGSTWLIELEFDSNSVVRGFQRGFARDVGRPGRAYDAALKQVPPYRVHPASEDVVRQKLWVAQDIENVSLLVTRFRTEHLRPGQTVSVQSAPDWWAALGRICSWSVVDAPALDRSDAALMLAPKMDGIILVVAADSTTASDVETTRRALEDRNGRILGICMNKVRGDAKLMERLGR